MSRLQTRHAQLPPSLRHLTLSTRLERMKAYGDTSSPGSANQRHSPFSPASPYTPSSAASDDASGFTSLPPPPRRTRPTPVPSKESNGTPKLTVKTFRRRSAISLDAAVLEESPTMAWLQREEDERGSIFGGIQPVAEEEEEGNAAKTEEEDAGEKRVSAAVAAAKAALEEAQAAADTDSLASNANHGHPEPECVRPESSLDLEGGIHVAEKQYFRTSKPRIISAGVSSPTTSSAREDSDKSASRLPSADDGRTEELRGVGRSTAQWSPGHHLDYFSPPKRPGKAFSGTSDVASKVVKSKSVGMDVSRDEPWRQRTLISHAKSASRSSGSSLDSTTTYNPPSTVYGPRVSISSTFYSDEYPCSEEGEFDPTTYHRHDILHDIQSEQVIDSDNYQLISILSGTSMRPHSPKPPVPRTPKPIFSRSPAPSSSSSSIIFEGYQSSDGWDPAAGNWLGQEERADLIRKSRKLARVFGRTPGADIMAYQESQSRATKHLRTPLSISNDLDNSVTLRQRRASAWPSPIEPHLSSNRRHSAPLSPDDISFLNVSSPLYDTSLSQVASQFQTATSSGSQVDGRASVTAHQERNRRESSPSRTSFIDWSDEEGLDDSLSIISQEPPSTKHRRPTSPTHSFFENLTPEEQAEEERRRKRERLAKLHRFLGSRVPVDLVVGPDFENDMHLRPSTVHSAGSSGGKTASDVEESNRKAWIRRRRSSSAAALPSWSDDMDRLKEELDTKEKLLNVRRAQKMEKVFGVAPPQTLYHTRGHTPSPSMPSLAPVAVKTMGNPSAFIPSSDAMYFTRNPNQSSYDKSSSSKLSRRRTGRPSTAESTKHLIPKGRRSSSTRSFNLGTSPPKHGVLKYGSPPEEGTFSYNQPPAHQEQQPEAWTSSAVYDHYQHSLKSLNDILDRDDRESLLELHNYLNQDQPDVDEDPSSPPPQRTRRLSDSSILTERRRSFPIDSSASASSLIIDSNSALSPTMTEFQQRRRRAAKLTQFFGVQYRELINDVLDSLENGLEHEQKRGTLQADEIADLLDRLRELKVKREGIAA